MWRRKKLRREQRNQSLFKEKSPPILQPCDSRHCAPHTAAPKPACCLCTTTAPDGRWGCGLLWSCAAASLRCNASRARFVFPCGDPADTKWHRWVWGRLFFCHFYLLQSLKLSSAEVLGTCWCVAAEWVALVEFWHCCTRWKSLILLHFTVTCTYSCFKWSPTP